MRTPLATILFFIERILEFINALKIKKDKKKTALRYAELALTQLQLTQCFVNNLLDLSHLKDGQFKLDLAHFDPSDTLKMVCNIFNSQAIAKGIEIKWKLVKQMLKIQPTFTDDFDSDGGSFMQLRNYDEYIYSSLNSLPRLMGDQRRLL